MLVVNDEDDSIVSRWFVMETVRTRAGQYKCALYRDIKADYWELIKSSPCFIDKAIANPDTIDVYNAENMTVNQIKKEELPLSDKTDSAWLVGYYAKNTSTGLSGTFGTLGVPNAININVPIASWTYAQYCDYNAISHSSTFNYLTSPLRYEFDVCNYANTKHVRAFAAEDLTYGGYTDVSSSSLTNARSRMGQGLNSANIANAFSTVLLAHSNPTTLRSAVNSQYNIATSAQLTNFLSFNGKVIKDSNNNYFRVAVVAQNPVANNPFIAQGTTLHTALQNGVYQSGAYRDSLGTYVEPIAGAPNSYTFKVDLNYVPYYMVLTNVLPSAVYSYTITNTNAPTEDAIYNTFAIPYGKVKVRTPNGDFTMDNDLSLAAALGIATNMGTSCYDLQLLPYCPFQENLDSNGYVDLRSKADYVNYISTNGSPATKVGVVLNVPRIKFHVQLDYSIAITDPKIQNDTEMYRLNSPNYAASFEFNPVRNNGVDFFEADCMYQPYTPYIHVAPNFKGLYGQDFDDARGLICTGDFSVPTLSDAWTNYQINNKNYEASFNRQIEYQEFQNKMQLKQQRWNAVAGAVGAASSGAVSGAFIGGGPAGAAVGAVVGGGLSAAAGIADISITKKMQAEAIDYSKDQFSMSLENIQALPYTLGGKVNPFNANNKLFPFIEKFGCSDLEVEALKNKIRYNGMRIERIGTFEEFIGNKNFYSWLADYPEYIKGTPIRIEGIEEDYNLINTLANEFNSGVFVQ